MKDQLYLLNPNFYKGDVGPLYCGDCVSVEGFLSIFPQLRGMIDVHYLDFPRPRKPLVEILGDEHQGAPVLIISDEQTIVDGQLSISLARGRRFITDERDIRHYLSVQYGLARES